MPERLKKRALRVVGVRQVLRMVRENRAGEVFLAMDADAPIRSQVERAAGQAGVPVRMVSSMEELAALCRVDVPSAAACIRRSEPSP